MHWLLFSVAALGIAAVALRRYAPWLEQILKPAAEAGPPRPVFRKLTALDRMIDDLRLAKDPLERHRLLETIVAESHRQRSDTAMNKVFLRFAGMHVKELPKMVEALKRAHGGALPQVSGFKLLAEALEEEGRHEEAASVRKQALELGLTDGTQAEWSGRLQKPTKKTKTARPAIKRAGRSRAPARRERKP
jgi:hypothetical protein